MSGSGRSSSSESGLVHESGMGSPGSGSSSSQRSHFTSTDIILLGESEEEEETGSDDEEMLSQGTVSYLDIPTQIMRKPARLQCTKRHARAISCTLPGETSAFARAMMI